MVQPFQRTARHADLLWSFLAPFLSLIFIILLDAKVKQISLSPLLSLILLAYLSARLGPRMMIFWIIISNVQVYFSLHTNFLGPEILPRDPLPTIRFLTFCVASGVCLMASLHRWRLEKNYDYMVDIVQQLPVPMIVSDENGGIYYANEKAMKILDITSAALDSETYFSLLSDPKRQGGFISSYLDFMEKQVSSGVSLHLNIRRKQGQIVVAEWMILRHAQQKLLLTVFDLVPNQEGHAFASGSPIGADPSE